MELLVQMLKKWLTRPHPFEWLCLAAGAALLVRYRWFLDDAFVYFRYVDNFLFLNLGLVYNPGEYVEGYSSPMWLLLLVLLRALEWSYAPAVLGTGLLLLFLIWCMLVALRREQAPQGHVLNLPMVLLLPNYAVLSYLTSGVDAPLVLLAGVGYALFIVRPTSAPLQLLVIASPLIRHELILPFGLCLLWRWYIVRRFPWHLLIAAGIAGGGWLTFRIYYYADLFPNTFYLKNDFLPWWGLLYVHDTLVAYHLYEALAVIGMLYVALLRRGEMTGWRQRVMMLAAATPVILYVIKIGGDARHFRYLAFPFCLLLCACGGIPERVWSVFRIRSPRLLLPAAGLLLGLFTFFCHPRQLDRHPLREDVGLRMVDGIHDAHLHRDRLIPEFSDWEERVTPDVLREFLASEKYMGRWPVVANELCIQNYLDFDKQIVHTYGLTDAILARADVPAWRPGHKDDLIWMADWLAELRRSPDSQGARPLSRAAESNRAPPWVRNNAGAIRLIENKIYNRHDFSENLRLALHLPIRLAVEVDGVRGIEKRRIREFRKPRQRTPHEPRD